MNGLQFPAVVMFLQTMGVAMLLPFLGTLVFVQLVSLHLLKLNSGIRPSRNPAMMPLL